MSSAKSKTMDAAEKLMLDLMEEHPGASAKQLSCLSIPVSAASVRLTVCGANGNQPRSEEDMVGPRQSVAKVCL